MRTIALVVEYDGTNFHGFQRQSSLPTVAAALETALTTLAGHAVSIVGAGRTDAGVHATGQVVSFETNSDLSLARAPLALSAMLREQRIAVLRAVERPKGFSARHDAVARTYRYRILNRVAPSPLEQRRVLHVRSPLDVARMGSGAQTLVGQHDFTSFCTQIPDQSSGLRTVERLAIARDGDLIELTITADSFLHQMVRIIAGTLIDVGRGKRTPEAVASTLAVRDRKAAGVTAPPHGLYLTHVRYAEPL